MKPYRGSEPKEFLETMIAFEGDCKYCGDQGMVKMHRDQNDGFALRPDDCQCLLCGQRYFMKVEDIKAFEQIQRQQKDEYEPAIQKVQIQVRAGTPKTLDEAIATAICTGELKHVVNNLYAHIKDFLSQKFGVAILGSDLHLDTKTSERMKRLFDEITKRETNYDHIDKR